ncbi:hypothetical protein IVB45_05090 [Bradyrhizobium sp. 4]|nr:hypothetical protein [Bradyrhizobium sp. 39]MCK1634669.1 hypothetical protein [Bradyrhizobium sp. 162]MCK1749241.1 hypothetical protein [Bradyrhizobium sp. 135]UPJ36343.1 hypothetical protein IVB45_05090 [Bradyrhizobium sp. 4]
MQHSQRHPSVRPGKSGSSNSDQDDIGSVADIAKAVFVCKDNGISVHLGGSCTETNLSARAAAKIAAAIQPT